MASLDTKIWTTLTEGDGRDAASLESHEGWTRFPGLSSQSLVAAGANETMLNYFDEERTKTGVLRTEQQQRQAAAAATPAWSKLADKYVVQQAGGGKVNLAALQSEGGDGPPPRRISRGGEPRSRVRGKRRRSRRGGRRVVLSCQQQVTECCVQSNGSTWTLDENSKEHRSQEVVCFQHHPRRDALGQPRE